MWTIFYRPADFPNDYVVVETAISAGAEMERRSVRTAATLEAARLLVPPHLYRQQRSPDDDAVVVETWF